MREKIDRALRILGIENLLLGVHEAALPGVADEDLGRGSPYSAGAAGFFELARNMGFTGILLGPQGITTPGNLSPYDGSWFARNPLSLAPLPLTAPEFGLLDPAELAAVVERFSPGRSRVDDQLARQAGGRIAGLVCRRFRARAAETEADFMPLLKAYAAYCTRNAAWLTRDALYDILTSSHGGRGWREWALAEDRQLLMAGNKARLATFVRLHATTIEDFRIVQFLLDLLHRRLRELCARLGLKLFGDCQIGMSDRDAWYAQAFLLPGYAMGAPPSRTHPQGQPWNYPLLDPRQYFAPGAKGKRRPGPALRFFVARMAKMAAEFDGLRLDHPHGLICPWVYRTGQADPFAAVRAGARLFASPHLADHPELAPFAIVRPDQLNDRARRYDDDWVKDLAPEQVLRYATLFAAAMAGGGKRRQRCEILCEILSTEPYPVKRVREFFGLGRFRVTQKADLTRQDDVYRSDNARGEDWLMLSTHDTEPIWQVAERWRQEGRDLAEAEYLAGRLAIPAEERQAWLARLAGEPARLVQAKFADLFLGPAANVFVYFTDLLGCRESYNTPGTVSRDNWTLRIPTDYRRIYRDKLEQGSALDIPRALALALRAKKLYPQQAELILGLENQH